MDSSLIQELASWFGFLVSAAFGNPIPEEVMIAMSGIRAAQLVDEYGPARWLLLPAVMLGALVADLLLYGLGRIFGLTLMNTSFMNRLAPPDKRERIRENFHQYGVIIFVIGRMVPGIRTTLFLTAGTMRLNLLRFCLADGLGALFGTTLFFGLGYVLGAQFKELIANVEAQVSPYKPIIILALIAIVGGYLLYTFLRHPIPTGDPVEVPLIGQQIAARLPHTEEHQTSIKSTQSGVTNHPRLGGEAHPPSTRVD